MQRTTHKVFYIAGTNIKDIALLSYDFIIIYNMQFCQSLYFFKRLGLKVSSAKLYFAKSSNQYESKFTFFKYIIKIIIPNIGFKINKNIEKIHEYDIITKI